MNRFDVVVMGGGPAGSLASRAALAQARVLLGERAPCREACCAGLVSLTTAQRLGIPKSIILREIRGVQIFGPEGSILELRADRPKALVLDRTGLDRWLVLAAQEKSVEVRPLAARAVEDNFVRCSGTSIPFETQVGADGVRSTVAVGLPGPKGLLVGAQLEAELGDQLRVFLGIVPDFFGGLCLRRKAKLRWAWPQAKAARLGKPCAPGSAKIWQTRGY